jgi:hypothetical protein
VCAHAFVDLPYNRSRDIYLIVIASHRVVVVVVVVVVVGRSVGGWR